MQLQARAPVPPPADDLARTLEGAAAVLGHRPAVTVLRPDRRDEQGVASLRQWAAKTAHWLAIEHGLGPGDRLALVGPPGWVPVAVCLGAWWAGVTVVLDDAAEADVAVVHEHAALPAGAEIVTWGAAVDGSPVVSTPHEPYAIAVQSFPDQPPPAAARPDLHAAEADGRAWTQAELLHAARALPDGRLGLDDVAVPPALWLPTLAVHPLTAGRPTVLLDGVGRDAAAGERVDSWVSAAPAFPPPEQAGPPT